MKFLYVLVVSLLVVGCVEDLLYPVTKEGEFKTDQEMSDFFIDNYPQPIFENGQRCEDLVVMSQRLG